MEAEAYQINIKGLFMKLTKKELCWAQKDFHMGARKVAEAGLRLNGTKFEGDYRRIWEAIIMLNDKLLAEIDKSK